MTTNSSKTVGFCLEGEKMFKKVPDQRQLGMKEHANLAQKIAQILYFQWVHQFFGQSFEKSPNGSNV